MYQEQKSPDHVGTNLGVRSFLHFSSSKLEHGLLQPKENKFSLRLSLKEVTPSTMVLNAGYKRQQIASSTSILTKPRMPALSPHGPSSECQFYLHIHQPTSTFTKPRILALPPTPTKFRILAQFPHPPSPDNSPKDSYFGFGPYSVAQEGFELVTVHFVAQRTTLMDTSWTSPRSPDQRVFVGAGLAAWPEIPIMPTVCSRRSYR